jgi:hypothetical protein
MHNIKRSILILATLALAAGCAGEVTDDADGAVDEAQTFGAPGFPMPDKMRVDPGDIVDVRLSDEPVACGGAVQADLAALKAACVAESVAGVSGVVISQSTPYSIATGLCRAKISCLFNVGDEQ